MSRYTIYQPENHCQTGSLTEKSANWYYFGLQDNHHINSLFLKVKADVEVRKRIELIQDFEMPAISDRLKVRHLEINNRSLSTTLECVFLTWQHLGLQ